MLSARATLCLMRQLAIWLGLGLGMCVCRWGCWSKYLFILLTLRLRSKRWYLSCSETESISDEGLCLKEDRDLEQLKLLRF